MAHPKRKISKQRRNKRRGDIKLAEPALSSCGNCGATHLMHTICQECGSYRGRQVIELDVA
jgi:large subunit ribosomal protein L32